MTTTETAFRRDLAEVLNRHSAENTSDTPDRVLAQFVDDALTAFDAAVLERSRFYGHHDAPGRTIAEVDPPDPAQAETADASSVLPAFPVTVTVSISDERHGHNECTTGVPRRVVHRREAIVTELVAAVVGVVHGYKPWGDDASAIVAEVGQGLASAAR